MKKQNSPVMPNAKSVMMNKPSVMMNKPSVMLNLFQHLLITILGGAFLCIVFASCDNFLKGSDVSEQLRDAIEIANSNPLLQCHK